MKEPRHLHVPSSALLLLSVSAPDTLLSSFLSLCFDSPLVPGAAARTDNGWNSVTYRGKKLKRFKCLIDQGESIFCCALAFRLRDTGAHTVAAQTGTELKQLEGRASRACGNENLVGSTSASPASSRQRRCEETESQE